MDWSKVKSLNDFKEHIDKWTHIPTRLLDDELHLLVNNKDFESFENNLGDNILIKIKDLEVFDYNIKFTVTAEKDKKELINITHYYDIDWEYNTSEQVWNWTIEKLIEANIILPNELKLGGDFILSPNDTNINTNERIVMKIFKEVFNEYSPEELEIITNDIVNKNPGFWIDVSFPTLHDNSTVSILVFADNPNYHEKFETNIFEIKNTFTQIKKELEELGFCKKK